MKLSLLSGLELIKILKKIGFEEIRQKGSHVYLRHSDGKSTVVPVHSKTDISRGLLKTILDEIQITREEFLKLL